MDSEVIELARELISMPSVTGNELESLKFTENWFRDNKFDSVVRGERFVCARVARRGNTSAVRRAVILCGHIDTVSPGEEEKWRYGPWNAKIDGDRLYGLGSGDMKAGVALQMIAARESAMEPHDADVWVAVVSDEEVSGSGSAEFTKYFDETTSYDEVYCMIAEPTDEGAIEIGHRGNRFVKLTFRGASAHASQEESYAQSAIPPMMKFLADLSTIRSALHEKYGHELMGNPSFTPTRVGHGEAFSLNQSTDIATVSIDVRTTPVLDDGFDSWLDELSEKYEFSWDYEAGYVSSALCTDDAKVLSVAKQLMPSARIAISHGATDQAFFQSHGIQTIVFGPGDFHLAHTCDESVSIRRTKEVLAFYMQIISKL